MSKKIFNLRSPVKCRIHLIKEDTNHEGSVDSIVVSLSKDSKMNISGRVLVTENLADKMSDVVLKNPTGLFDLYFRTNDQKVIIYRCIGDKESTIYMLGEKMARVYFSQACIKDTSDSNHPEDSSFTSDFVYDFITCPTSPSLDPNLGDLYWDSETQAIRIFMSNGWYTTNYKYSEAPSIEARKKIEVPNFTAVFYCSPPKNRRWHRDIDSRRVKVIQRTINKKRGNPQ
jgi:hypothetical protein